MMMTETFFFDTYAFMEIVKSNPNYNPYLKSRIATTKLNLFEFYYSILRNHSEDKANQAIDHLQEFLVDFNVETLKESAKLKSLFGRKVSMTDCIGYITAKKMNIKFLTGDKQFEFLPDVEFVK